MRGVPVAACTAALPGGTKRIRLVWKDFCCIMYGGKAVCELAPFGPLCMVDTTPVATICGPTD